MMSGFGGFTPKQSTMMSGFGSLLGGLFGDSGAPFSAGMDQLQNMTGKAENIQNPFINAGTNAIGKYQDWLTGMQDPSKFINNLMNNYQASPWSQYQQMQAMRAGQNAASVGGLMGSTPFAQQLQQNASNIASGDMNNWLQHVLGINSQYGAGNQYLMGQGQNAANALTQLYGDMAKSMAQMAYGQQAGENQDMWNTIGGAMQIGAGALFL